MERSFAPGDVVRDNYGREGIVVRDAPTPPKAWLDEQEDARVAGLPSGERWYTVLPLDGGGVWTPETLTEWVRHAEPADLLTAVAHANKDGVRELVALFPDMARTIVARSPSGGARLLTPGDALRLVALARADGVPVQGIEAFRVGPAATRPLDDWIADFSEPGGRTADQSCDAASRFLASLVEAGLGADVRVEVTLAD